MQGRGESSQARNRRGRAGLALVAVAAVLAACAYRPPPGPNKLITNPDGTVDTTHGVKGSQTAPS
jgi:hypothetical protein